MQPLHPPLSPTVRASRLLAVGGVLALIALGLAWELWLSPLRPGGSWLALKVLPLTAALAGLLKLRLYTYRWLSLLVWLYFAEGVVRASSESGANAALALVQVLLSLLTFTGCVLHVRARVRRAPASNATEPMATAKP